MAAGRHRPTEEETRQAMFERLRYFVWLARRDPKALSLEEIDELCRYVVALAPKKRTR